MNNYQQLMKQWHDYNFPNQNPEKPLKVLLKLSEEAGELSRAHLNRMDGVKGTREYWDSKVVDAVGDVFLALCVYCNETGLTLEKCVAAAWDEIKDRDWRKYPETGRPPEDSQETLKSIGEK